MPSPVTLGYAGEYELIHDHLTRGWRQIYPDIPIAKTWGEKLDLDGQKDAAGKPKPFLLLTVSGVDGRPIEIGSPGSNTHAFIGQISVNVYVSADDGTPLARRLGDDVLNLFKPGVFTAFPLRRRWYADVGETTGERWLGNVTVTFERHEPA